MWLEPFNWNNDVQEKFKKVFSLNMTTKIHYNIDLI